MRRPQAKPKLKPFQTPGVVFQPDTFIGLKKGVHQLVNAIRPTLGPLPRFVAIEQNMGRMDKPELLDSGGTIARRVIQLPDRNQDVGAMYLRNMLWKLQEKTGDGTATAAVIFEKVFDEGLRYVASGGNAMMLRRGLESGAALVAAELDRKVTRISGKQRLSKLAESICYDPELARMLGEIFDVIGEYGQLELRSGQSRTLEREYTEGTYWDNGLISRTLTDPDKLFRADLEDAAVVLTDLSITEPGDLVPMLDIAYHAGFKTLVLTVSDMTDLALSVLNAPTVKEKIRAIVVKAPSSMQDVRRSALEDLGVLTGATPLRHETSDTLTAIRLEQIGRARRIWADENFFGVVGGQGDPRKLREHIARLRSAYLGVDDRDDRKKLLDRIGRLMGGSATLWVGDVTLSAIESRKVLAQRTTEAMRGAMREGVVPGAGVALLDSRSVLQAALKQTSDPDERVAYRILLRALQEPLRVLLENAGLDAKEVMAKIELAGPGHGYDVLAGKLVQVDQSGLVDSAAVVRNALFGAVHGAALLLVTDVIVHIKNPADGSQTT